MKSFDDFVERQCNKFFIGPREGGKGTQYMDKEAFNLPNDMLHLTFGSLTDKEIKKINRFHRRHRIKNVYTDKEHYREKKGSIPVFGQEDQYDVLDDAVLTRREISTGKVGSFDYLSNQHTYTLTYKVADIVEKKKNHTLEVYVSGVDITSPEGRRELFGNKFVQELVSLHGTYKGFPAYIDSCLMNLGQEPDNPSKWIE